MSDPPSATDRAVCPLMPKGPFKNSAGREPEKTSHISWACELGVVPNWPSTLRIVSEKLIDSAKEGNL